ncbi:heat stress transcription factor B-4-like [Bidens hawaiensis]|uniref:heat stress transcription factor B-4-like n=1 Tax=Bidens hawaiensis TaxID=980011 RepID=UPI00404A3AAD
MALMIDNSCEGMLLSLDAHKSMPAPFLTKTYQLVDDSTTDHIVSWGEDDTTFVVWRPPEFARDLLPNYFKHNNFSSFVRQLNTYGFRKIVPDRWEFANEFFKKGEKHLLCEIHRRKTSQPHVGLNHNHFNFTNIGGGGNGVFSYPRDSISPPNSDEHLCCDSPTTTTTTGGGSILGILLNNNGININSNSNSNGNGNGNIRGNSVTALSKDNERLRRSNNMLMSELAHMRKLYNDVIYFVQNHVKPVTPSNSYPSSLLLPSATNVPLFNAGSNYTNATVVYPSSKPQQLNCDHDRTKLFGVPLLSKKRLHPDHYGLTNGNSTVNVESHKARLIVEKDDLGLKLMPPSPC